METASLRDLTARLDATEDRAWNRLGGPSRGDRMEITRLERQICEAPADCLTVAMWRVRRLVRAVQNDWMDEVIQPLAASVERDAMLFG